MAEVGQLKESCTRVEFDCEICGTHVSKWWHPNMPGRPRFCSRKCKSEFQRRAKPVTKEWLEQKYLREGLDCTQIGKIVSRNSKSVWNWLKDFGIPTRPRGINVIHLPRGRPAGFTLSPETRGKIRSAALADGRRPWKKENGPPWKGKGGSLHPSWKGGITAERQTFYATDEWKRASRQARRRDRYTCQRCGAGKRSGLSFDLHHIVPFGHVPLRAVVSNLVLLCEPCHYWVHSSSNVDGRFILPCP